MSNHKLYLGMFTFQIKKTRTKDSEIITNNDFLSAAYPDLDNKFTEGFAQDIISLFDAKVFKNKRNTHGGTLDDRSIASGSRYFDILIDGGITGIQQYLVSSDGSKQKIPRDNIVGLKFYARFWLPASSKTGYVFIQRYASLNLKPLFDEIIRETLTKHGFIMAVNSNRMRPTTTKKRMKAFLEKSSLRHITIFSRESKHDTSDGDAKSVMIKLRNVKMSVVNKKNISKALKNHGFTIADRHYDMRATYVADDDTKEEKTTILDDTEDTINIIPNIVIPGSCIDSNGYPEFEAMKKFVDAEIRQLKKEAKL